MILTALSTLTFLGKNIPSLKPTDLWPKFGNTPWLQAEDGLLLGFGNPKNSWWEQVCSIKPRSWGVHQSTQTPLVAHLVCVMRESTKTFVGMFIFLFTPLFGTTGSVHMPEPVSQPPFHSPTLALYGSHSTDAKMQAKPWPVLSFLWGTEWYLNEEGKEACRARRMPEVLNLGTKGYFSIFCFHLY